MKLNIRDIVGGAIIAILSTAFLYLSFDYEIGTTRRMGPAYFPMLVSSLGIILGLAIVVSGLKVEAPMPRIAIRPVVCITLALITFGLTVQSLGLLPASALVVVISALGNPGNGPRAVAVMGATAFALAWVIFIVGLSVPVPSFAGVLSWM